MKTKLTLVAFATSILIVSNGVSASSAKNDIYTSDNQFDRISVKWVEPKTFSDVREANYSTAKSRERVFNQLEKHLDKLAEDLPEGQTINFTFTNVDLAGRVEPASFIGLSNSISDVRVMRDVDIPRIKFEYELVDTNGAVIRAEEVNLKNMNYLREIRLSSRNSPYEHEKQMLSEWFSKNIIEDRA